MIVVISVISDIIIVHEYLRDFFEQRLPQLFFIRGDVNLRGLELKVFAVSGSMEILIDIRSLQTLVDERNQQIHLHAVDIIICGNNLFVFSNDLQEWLFPLAGQIVDKLLIINPLPTFRSFQGINWRP